MKRYKIITLCGSLRFIKTFVETQIILERCGHVVLSVTAGEENNPPTEKQKAILDKVHYRKIDLSDCIIVIDNEGYIGSSTANEMQWADLTNKPVFMLSKIDPYDFISDWG